MSIAVLNSGAGAGNRRAAVAVLFLAAFINLLDVTIVNLALPAIRNDLGASETELEWILVIYVVAFASGLLPFGRFGDIFGRKQVFIWGVAGFVLSSSICGMATSSGILIAARGLQGLSAAMMVPQVLAIVHVLFRTEERGRVIGLYGVVSALGAVSGPVSGGAILAIDFAGLSWRPIFLLNIPLGLFSLIGAMRFVPSIVAEPTLKPDWAGAVLFFLAIVSLTFPLVEGRHLGWPWWCLVLLGGAVMLAVVFLKHQANRASRAMTQLLPICLLKDRDFVFGLSVVVAFFSGIAGVFFMLAIFLQSGFGFSPLVAGLIIAPHPVGAMIASYLSGRVGHRWLEYRITLGAALLALGMTGLMLVVDAAESNLSGWRFMMPLFVVGTGMGTAVPALFQSVLSRVSGLDAGAGSGVLQAFQQIGIAIGIAVIGQIFFGSLEGQRSEAGFVTAARTALWFPVGIYLLLAIVCFWSARQSPEKPAP
ncbi:MAG: MFS transporter [Roseibium sp.]|uniref:MFS transporter n=1 Tax=Roseibium sp. TaxID=1936156 RepID=UPI00262C35AF|nr:MFS transporter [Roseibium sp.]MCV0427151.1 MFS transporter [Roseibium sp.]